MNPFLRSIIEISDDLRNNSVNVFFSPNFYERVAYSAKSIYAIISV
jgi:hypothetical protein